jgi:nitronate monooxygenase
MTWSIKTSITKLLNIKYPIILAPMAKVSSAQLVATISNSGGLGSFGAAMLSPEELRKTIKDIRNLTSKPFAINLFALRDHLADCKVDQRSQMEMRQVSNEFRRELNLEQDLTDGNYAYEYPYAFSEQVDVIVQERVPVFSFTFGIPSDSILQKLRQNGTKIIGTANSLEEARLLECSGVDAIVAQGLEAGGHRAKFTNAEMLPLFSLVQQIVNTIPHLPVIASGGIMNGRGIVSALALGASAVQMGTAFIPTDESNANKIWKSTLLNGYMAEEGTLLTKSITGRQCRFLSNRIVKKLHEYEEGAYPYPIQSKVMGDIYSAAEKKNRPDLLPMMAGQNAILCKDQPTKATQVFEKLISEATKVIEQLAHD